jgi:hypothetical protein
MAALGAAPSVGAVSIQCRKKNSRLFLDLYNGNSTIAIEVREFSSKNH